ncbi:MAG: DEAD/DEAH box helicase [Acidimicrobiia bacterium]|nr:DEAD/DEAH box helicase [Acidimicrobiia bacterium]
MTAAAPPRPAPDFEPDEFQREAMRAVDRGESVLVAAPTGAGKTLVAEHALRRALADGRKAFYTTPIKALSNQKYRDLVAEHGEASVGLLTGDHSINGDAPVVVMTTEVLRNMLYTGSPALAGLSWVVLDEVHYLRDPFRGAVWEEVIIHAPADVRLVALSATVSNVDELVEWLREVRGPTSLVTEYRRPVELTHFELIGDPGSDHDVFLPIIVDGRPNRHGHSYDRHPRRGRGRRYRTPSRVDVVDRIAGEDLLPAIYFLFSRAGCDDAAATVRDAGLGLTTPDEREHIAVIAARHLAALDDGELDVLGSQLFLSGLASGVAAHHAGLVPAFKETVEECFLAGLVKVVFATETLALGINMPARAVIIERLTKFNGETHETLTPLEYTQLTGRAGRRGLDTFGTAVVLWSPWISFDEIASLVGSTDYRLTSAFRPSYNMAANLVSGHDPSEAKRLLRLSFAQFQADREIVGLERQRLRRLRTIDEAEAEAACDHGDVAAAVAAGEAAQRATAGELRGALSRLRPGSIITLPGSTSTGAVLSVAHRRNGEIRVRMVDADGADLMFGLDDFTVVPASTDHIELPTPYVPERVAFRGEVAERLRLALRRRGGGKRDGSTRRVDSDALPDDIARTRSCPDFDVHIAALDRLRREKRSLVRVERRLDDRATGLDRQFDAIIALLQTRNCLDGWRLDTKGMLLLAIFHESDLLVVEAMASGLFDDLDAPSVAALASCLSFAPRSDEPSPRQRLPTRQLRERVDGLYRLADELEADEAEAGVQLTRRPDEGFVLPAYRWTEGRELASTLGEDLTGGDFVRNTKQLIDLLRQLGSVVPDPVTATTARRAVGALDRGVVAAGSITEAAGPDEPAGDANR